VLRPAQGGSAAPHPAGYELWFTGVRRDEAPTRTNTPLVTWDETNGLVKVNPMAAWTFDQLVQYSDDNLLPVNPLLSQGYPSIGCQPCTRKVAPATTPAPAAGQEPTRQNADYTYEHFPN
jgi:3'-phosphoadenosine 5'-phosphosulfate sulfotransferase (PAPS reductase)/FAD synthetase